MAKKSFQQPFVDIVDNLPHVDPLACPVAIVLVPLLSFRPSPRLACRETGRHAVLVLAPRRPVRLVPLLVLLVE